MHPLSTMSKPTRLDALLVKRGLAASRARARELIEAGHVQVDGIAATKAARQVRTDQAIHLVQDDHKWVSRGALKLLGVIDAFGVQAQGRVCADLGASTGGFTEVLLERGAQRVYAIDVGHNQLAWKLQTDERVVVMDRTNARHLDALPEPVSLIVGDLSFISLSLILPTVARLLAPDGEAVLLVKPQFEAGRDAIAKGGRVKSEALRGAAIDQAKAAAVRNGFAVVGGMDCPLPGAKAGNIEYFVHLSLQVGEPHASQ